MTDRVDEVDVFEVHEVLAEFFKHFSIVDRFGFEVLVVCQLRRSKDFELWSNFKQISVFLE